MESLRVLMVEDSANDVELTLRALQEVYLVDYEQVETEKDMRQALEDKIWDIVISDYSMPGFDGLSAIALLKRLRPHTPIILLSGTVGEETAVEAMRAGASDYVMKDQLARLAPAVERELRESSLLKRLKDSEEQLRQAQKMEVVGHMAGCIAHDFNNVLSVIFMYCDTLQMTPNVPESAVKAVEQIKKSGMRAANLTRQLLAFSRKQVLEPKILVLNSIVAGFEKMLQRLIGETIQLSLELAPDAWQVKVDPGQVEQVIMNLGINSRDAMPKGGKLTVKTSNATVSKCDGMVPDMVPGSYSVLSVADTGLGMSPEVQKRIFDPFFTTKGPDKGTGLGLSTVYGIVKQSGGFISVKSAPGEGTFFEIYFPRVDLPVSVQKQENVGLSAADQSVTIVLMEDQEDVRKVFADALRLSGYEVIAPSTCEEALSLLETRRDKIRLLIADVVMPTLSGPELAEKFIAASPAIKVILVSGYLADQVEGYESIKRRFLFLQKPFSLQQLLEKVKEGLKAPSSS